ncbi:MYND finger protein [Rhizoctonia solani AG-3 Rhs1AP]|uniref:MYND finger protein n=2 Tax=Rhizoctonia solani AG-3 TaxID=1086053 RepID=X8IWC4_9AGAM|nr:MYND finger protein [Rhizoctonia solani AG-3 Rhs1AP]
MCGGPGKPELRACSQCKQARYCSVLCQRQGWKAHKKYCRAP